MNEENLVQNVLTLHRYRVFRVGAFYFDSACRRTLTQRESEWWDLAKRPVCCRRQCCWWVGCSRLSCAPVVADGRWRWASGCLATFVWLVQRLTSPASRQPAALHSACTAPCTLQHRNHCTPIAYRTLPSDFTMENISAQCRHIVRPSAWPLTFWTENY